MYSLATLLSFAPHQSLSPAISSVSLSTMAPQAKSPKSTSSPRLTTDTLKPMSSLAKMASPFAFALCEDAEEEWLEHSDAQEDAYSGSSDDGGTQLAPRNSTAYSRAVPIPPPSAIAPGHFRGRSSSDSLPEPPAFSPYQSRPLVLGPSSASPPTWSRRRRRRGRRSASPPAASVEDRRRARMRGRGTTDAEESERGEDKFFSSNLNIR